MLLVLDIAIVAGHALGAFEEQPFRELHDVGFVNGGHQMGLVGRVLEGEARDPSRGAGGYYFDALDHARRDLMLDSGVEVLGILANHNQVDAAERCMHSGLLRTGRTLA